MSFSLQLVQPSNLTRQETVPSQIDRTKDIIPYGNLDNFPLRLARLVQNSPTGSSCIDTKTDFIQGMGFSESTIADLKINSQGERFGDLHGLNSDAWGTFEGFAINVKYNIQGAITELYSIPFEYCRFGIPDSNGVINKIHVNPYFGTTEWRKSYTKIYDVYNPELKSVKAQQARDSTKYKGQILYVATTGPLSRFYPNPKYYSCHYWLAIDEAIGGFHKNNIENNFLQSILFTLVGDENAPSSHPEDQKWNATTNQYEADPSKTNGYRFNLEMQKFMGWTKGGNMMALWALMKEALPTIQAFPSNTNSDLFKILQDITTEQIARATKVPAILANIASGANLGGDGNIIRASVKLMQQRVVKTHGMFERVYKDLLSRMAKPFTGDVKILHYDPFPEVSYKSTDPSIWAVLTLEEKRNWIKKNTDYELLVDKPTTVPDNHPIPIDPPSDVPRGTQQPLTNQFSNVFWADYPQKAKNNAQKARDFLEKTSSNCGGKAGRLLNEQIIAGAPLSFKTVKRIYNFLNKNLTFADHVFSDSCESVLFSGWGGKDMMMWAKDKIGSINE